MTKPELKILERVFEAEVNCALTGGITHLCRIKSKLAVKLTEEGCLRLSKTVWRGVTIEGYELTELGRLLYCTSGTEF